MQSSENIAMTVYGPEVRQSSLTSLLDRYITGNTGLEAVERFHVMHDATSINRFYSLTDSTGGAYWPLVIDLFDKRAACVTVWKGRGALVALQAIKGATQPANADPHSIRGRFWCDNPVCNLLHVSDNPSIMQEELQILRFQEIAESENNSENIRDTLNINHVQHSALWEFSKILSELSKHKISEIPFSASGKAQETAILLIDYIMTSAKNAPRWVEEAAIRYLNGEPRSVGTIKSRCRRLSPWQSLVLGCGLHSNPVWMKVIQTEDAAI